MPVIFVGRHLFKMSNCTWGCALSSLGLHYSFEIFVSVQCFSWSNDFLWFPYHCLNETSLVPQYIFPWHFRRFDVIFALYIMLVIWQWLEREQSRLFIQLQIIVCLFFSVITSLFCIVITDLILTMQLLLISTLFLFDISYLWLFEKCFWIKRKYL